MEFVFQGASIECDSAEIISRDIKASSFVNLPEIGNCQKYNCKRNSEAKILEELEPKRALYKPGSHLDKDDTLKSEDIVIYINSLKSVKKEVIPFSHRHKAQKTITKCFTYAEISLQFPNIQALKDPRQVPAIPDELEE